MRAGARDASEIDVGVFRQAACERRGEDAIAPEARAPSPVALRAATSPTGGEVDGIRGELGGTPASLVGEGWG